MPQNRLDEGETHREAALRELQEELGSTKMGRRQELFPVTRGLYQPKTATVDLIMRPPLAARRICLPIAAQKTCGN